MFIYWKGGAGGASVDPGVSNVLFGVNYEINGVNLTGTLQAVTTEIGSATLVGQSLNATLTPTGGSGMLAFSQNDANVILNLTATDGSGNPVDISTATFQTQILGPLGVLVTIGNGQHTIVSGPNGQYQVTLTQAQTLACGLGPNKDVVTQITIGGQVIYYHGNGILTVNPMVPVA